jgi:CheY-like chemotaxis protein
MATTPEGPTDHGALVAGLAHDFNNMLLALTACLELIRSRSSESRTLDIAGRGLETIDRGKELIERLLALGGLPPAGDAAAPHAADAAAPEAPAERLILVIDDDTDVRMVLVELLQSLDYQVIEASDGAAALAAMDRNPDLAIVDCELAGQNGADVAGQLLDRRPGLPIVFATGYSEPRSTDPRLVAAPFLRKPFRIAELANTVMAALGT